MSGGGDSEFGYSLIGAIVAETGMSREPDWRGCTTAEQVLGWEVYIPSYVYPRKHWIEYDRHEFHSLDEMKLRGCKHWFSYIFIYLMSLLLQLDCCSHKCE